MREGPPATLAGGILANSKNLANSKQVESTQQISWPIRLTPQRRLHCGDASAHIYKVKLRSCPVNLRTNALQGAVHLLLFVTFILLMVQG